MLSQKEKENIVAFSVERAAGRIPVIAGTGSNDTARALELSRSAQSLGADALLIVTPYYNKTTQSGLVKHYYHIADMVDIPVIAYNVPSRTGMTVTPQTCLELSRHPNIAAIKEASTDIDAIMTAMSLCGENLDFYCGNDSLTLPFLAMGGKGLISAAANLIPGVMNELCSLCLSGRISQARELSMKYNRLINMLFCQVNPLPVKAALEITGMCGSETRPPLYDMDEEYRDKLKSVLAEYGLTSQDP